MRGKVKTSGNCARSGNPGTLPYPGRFYAHLEVRFGGVGGRMVMYSSHV